MLERYTGFREPVKRDKLRIIQMVISLPALFIGYWFGLKWLFEGSPIQ